MITNLARTVALLGLFTFASLASAQNNPLDMMSEESPSDSSWHSETTPEPELTPRMIIQQKAQARAYQRIARIESMKWYGMSASRPLSNATPFAGVPSPRWEMPGGRPFSWYPSRSSVILVR
ncbi:hypothetical protein [Aeoliella mucimassa]|uniref:Uncharacterized protein n=1 Tax=Aeoliella mucimassa TaxID=2527972 RepID=A0A518ANJ2_9BACT|nr:hypothetical protein [Aeoliella mucimassa]QDU56287.1 hypothetical protein Pan181_24960 [Aeoliella mucimassa]